MIQVTGNVADTVRVVNSIWAYVVPTSVVGFWAMVAGLGTCATAFIAWRGLRSIRVAQADIELRTQREASAIAIERGRELAEELLPEGAGILAALAAEDVRRFITSPTDVLFDPDNTKLLGDAATWRKQISPALDWRCLQYINRFEAWSMYFATGVADDTVAFGPCAQVFCNFVVRYYPFLLMARADELAGNFPNVVKLFKAWNGLLEKDKLGLKADHLMQQLDELTEKASRNIESLPGPKMGKRV